ncbi:DUF2306 domain-containing protein [Sphingomonas sp. GB1N7]|uniref:DUF2306 domain-containing protein n=1 Tax=Parasphingomonas caseinilytica TaxID=3096158 RepID=UPI002FC8F1F8
MATIFETEAAPKLQSLAPDTLERVLAVGSAVLLAAVVAALVRGHAHWGEIPGIVWAHLLTIMIALVLTATMLLRRRGDRPHRVLGTIWVVAMLATALISFGVRQTNPGGFSFIHIISAWTVIQVPIIWWSARTHNIVRHRRSVRGMVIGALLVAGFFTFPFHRLLGQWLFG